MQQEAHSFDVYEPDDNQYALIVAQVQYLIFFCLSMFLLIIYFISPAGLHSSELDSLSSAVVLRYCQYSMKPK